MGMLLLVVVVLISLALTVKAWRGYEAVFHRNPGVGSDSIGPIPGEPLVDGNSSSDLSHTHHGGTDCGGFHHGGCDVGHGGFDGGGHH